MSNMRSVMAMILEHRNVTAQLNCAQMSVLISDVVQELLLFENPDTGTSGR